MIVQCAAERDVDTSQHSALANLSSPLTTAACPPPIFPDAPEIVNFTIQPAATAAEYWGMDVSSITSALVGLKAAETAASVQYAVAGKLLRTQRQQGDAILQLLQSASRQVESAAAEVLDATGSLDLYA